MPPLIDPRVLPLASIRLFDAGQGDPLLQDRGWGWWYVIQQDPFPEQRINVTTAGEKTLEVVEGVGLVCRPQLVMANTRRTSYTVSGGAWEERRPASGVRVYRLVQFDTAANAYSALSSFNLPADPHFIFELNFIDTPPDHDYVGFPPYIRVQFGGDLWGIEFGKTNGTALVTNTGGDAWEVVTPLDEPTKIGNYDTGAAVVIVRMLRGQLCVSTDFGRHYTRYQLSDGSAVAIPSGKLRVRGVGGMCIFGLHQLKYVTGTYTSPTKSTFTSRGLAFANITGRSSLPGSTGISFSDLSAPGAGIAQWGATLTPEAIAGSPFVHYRTPELYSVKFKYPTIRTGGTGAYTTPWDNDVLEIDIDKPLALDGASASVRIYRDAHTNFTSSALRWRKVAILLGGLYDDNSTSMDGTFVGYIRQVRIPQNEFGKSRIELEIDPGSTPPKRQEWDDFMTPLGGQTTNMALDEVLDSMGFTAADRVWHVQGDFVGLPAGSPEDPFMWPRAGENKWATMETIAKYAGLELFRDDVGLWRSLPLDYCEPVVSHVWEADPAAGTGDATASIQGIGYGVNVAESATCVIARGLDEFGNPIWAFGVDNDAEGNLASARFCPWRETVSINVDGTSSVGYLARVVQSWFITHIGLKYEADLAVPVKLTVGRRQRVQVVGTTVGINNTDEFVVMSLKHQYRPTVFGCRTTAGLRRIGV